MASWRLAPALEQMRREADAIAPDRSRRSDGTIGDAAHAARRSDRLQIASAIDTCLSEASPSSRGEVFFDMWTCRGVITTDAVLKQRNGVKVSRVDAMPVETSALTDMVDFVGQRNRSDPEFIGVAVGMGLGPFPLALDGKEPISVWFDAPEPKPTFVIGSDRNHVEEALFFRTAGWSVEVGIRHTPKRIRLVV